jgi:hypothetical protein
MGMDRIAVLSRLGKQGVGWKSGGRIRKIIYYG